MQGLLPGFEYLIAGLQARRQCASGNSCDRPNPSSLFRGFPRLQNNADLTPLFHVALRAARAAPPNIIFNILPLRCYQNKPISLF